MNLAGRIALVTGASSGVGAAIAKGLAAAGADVVINYCHKRQGALATAKAVGELGRAALVVQADVGKADAVRAMFERVGREFGRLDILVNNAGLTLKKPFADSSEADWDLVLDTNLKSVFLCSQAALPLFQNGGAILNVSSAHAWSSTFNFSVYAASKGGMEALTRSLAIELGPRGIRVNAVRLGWIQVERDHIERSDPFYEAVCERIPLRRPGEVADVVPTAVHLCSDAAAYVTGATIVVDGGHSAMLNTAFAHGHVAAGARTDRPGGRP